MATDKTNIYAALCKAQKAFKPAIKDTANPFFKSKYADLASIWDACKDALSDNDLFVSQSIAIGETGPVLVTKVFHISGEFLESTCPIICGKQNDPQAFGSAVTYTRRYSLAPLLGLITDDDDGEGAMVRPATNVQPKQQKITEPTKEYATEIQKDRFKELMQDEVWSDYERETALEKMRSYGRNEIAQKIAIIEREIKIREAKAA